MTASRSNRFWTLIIVLLVVITVTGAVLAWMRYRPDKPIEITVAPQQDLREQIYIGGASYSGWRWHHRCCRHYSTRAPFAHHRRW